MTDYDFPTEWRKDAIQDMRGKLRHVEKSLARLKSTTSRYYLGHVQARDLYRAALNAMEAIPPIPKDTP